MISAPFSLFVFLGLKYKQNARRSETETFFDLRGLVTNILKLL